MATGSAPEAQVSAVHRTDELTLVNIRLCAGLTPPLAPATLILDHTPVLELDALVSIDGDDATFRSKAVPAMDLEGRTVGLQQWCMPSAFNAVVDTDREWVQEPAPQPSGHEHCILDWATIEQGTDTTLGWRSGQDWICPQCYERYIIEDYLDLRRTTS